MTECFVGTNKHRNCVSVIWEDSEGYRTGLAELHERRLFSRGIQIDDYSRDKAQDFDTWIKSLSHIQETRPRKLLMGQYYRRIHRPCSTSFPYDIPDYADIIETSATAIEVLIDRLDHLFRVIEPGTANCSAYGHEIRSLLLLASTEVETAWKAVLRANNYPAECRGRKWTTADYVKLLDPLHLSGYELKLTSYPGVPLLTPFTGWDSKRATKSLPWYHAYNQTKHDREINFSMGTLKHAIDAVAATVVLFYAQYGQTYYDYEDEFFKLRLRFEQFHVTRWPDFPPEEWYVIESGSRDWAAVNYPLCEVTGGS